MRNVTARMALFSLAVAASGCAANPLVGAWVASDTSNPALQILIRLQLQLDGQAEVTATPGTVADPRITCTGSMTRSGIRWASTNATLSLLGEGTCSGRIVCSGGGSSTETDCTTSPLGVIHGAGSYTLSSDQNTLTVGERTYTRR